MKSSKWRANNKACHFDCMPSGPQLIVSASPELNNYSSLLAVHSLPVLCSRDRQATNNNPSLSIVSHAYLGFAMTTGSTPAAGRTKRDFLADVEATPPRKTGKTKEKRKKNLIFFPYRCAGLGWNAACMPTISVVDPCFYDV